MKKFVLLIYLFSILTIILQSLNPMNTKDNEIVEARIKKFNQIIPKEHPRVLVLRSELNEFREFINKIKEDKNYSYILKKIPVEKFNLPLTEEPKRIPNDKNADRTNMWRKAYMDSFNAGITAQFYSFLYMVLDDKRYANEAARWLMHLASWDIKGGTDIKNNDEAFIQSLRPMIIAYDWVYDALTQKEREYIEKALKLRLEILFEHVTNTYLAIEPISIEKNNSHKMRFISTIGIAGLSLYHELKDAPKYLSWSYEYYNRQFPSWGGKDGGYSEGLDYWQTGHNQHFMFLDSMKALKLEEIFNRDYFKNNGYFAIYNILPYKFSSFGDLCNSIKPDTNTAMHIEKYALIYKDPYLMNFHDMIFEKYPTGFSYYNYSFFDSLFQLFRKGNLKIEKKNLNELPRSRVFRDVGWTAIHSELGSKTYDIMLGFKSSPYGSASHSFADQNSFVLNAFGEMLAISSGYREWYGSPHHFGYTKSTMSKNAILFDNKGQLINDPNAKGEIIYFYTGENFDYTSGNALKSYESSLGVLKSLRSILFINKKYFIIFDEVENKTPMTHQWLLHSKEKIIERPDENEVEIIKKNAGLLAHFILPDKEELKFYQTDQFTVPVDKNYRSKIKNEWHFTLNAYKPKTSREFITLLYPYKKDNKESINAGLIRSTKGYIINCVSKDSTDTVFLTKDNENITQSYKDFFKGKTAVISKNNNFTNFVIIEGNELKSNDMVINSNKNLTCEGKFELEKISINFLLNEKTEVKIKVPFEPKKIEGITKGNYKYDLSTTMVTLILNEDGEVMLGN